jgi:antitoxin component of MazEF toxin-antitoxin module
MRKKYIRSIIKLGNSKAITFPQDWTKEANLKEKAEISIYTIDNKTIIIRTIDEKEQKTVFKIDGNKWAIKLIKQGVISAFKLGINEIYISYNDDNYNDLNELLIDLRSEIIGLDFKELTESNKFLIIFLLDTSKTNFTDVLMDLANVFYIIIKNVIEGNTKKKKKKLLLNEIDRKYSLGTRILITGLSAYPISKVYSNLPVIRFLGDRVVLLYIRDFINESLNLQNLPLEIIKKYSELLLKIPKFLINLIENYNNINLESISNFQEYLIKLHSILEAIDFEMDSNIELQIRNTINYYLNSFENFFDIGITRMIESEIGMV